MEKSVLSIPRLAGKSVIALVVLILVSASAHAQPVLVTTINKTSHSFTNVNGKVYFASNDSLYMASASGVTLIRKLNENISFISTISMGEKFFVITASSTTKQGLWVSEGSAASTVKVGEYPAITPRKVFQDNLYLTINDGAHGIELWKLSPTNVLMMLKDINPGTADGLAQYESMTISNNQLYFVANNGAGDDIWKTDGTTAGTVKAVDLPFQNIDDLTDVNGTMFFEHDSLSTDYYDQYTELWKTNGTLATTSLVKDFGYAYQYNSLLDFKEFNDKLYFVHQLESEYNLYTSNGTEVGTQVVTTTAEGIESNMYRLVEFREYLVWYSETQGFAGDIRKTDGTSAGTSTVHSLNHIYIPPGYNFSYVDLTPAGDRLYFVDHATQEWPNPGEEYVLYESSPEYTPSTSESMLSRYNFPYNNTKNLTAVTDNNILFTTWDDGSNYYRLWFYDPDGQSPCGSTGGLTREVWTNVTGNKVSSIPLSREPDYTEMVTAFAGPVNDANNYGARYSGYLCVPESGDYKFMIASDDYSELYLSTSSMKENKKLIAYVYGATKQNEFTKFASQKSALIHLEQGTKYYIEALHKEGGTYDHLMVAMQFPDGKIENPILGTHLSPSITNEAPTVIITNPSSSEINTHEEIPFTVDATDTDGAIVRVEFFLKNLTNGGGPWQLAYDTEAPYETTFEVSDYDEYRIIAKAYDNANAVGYDSINVQANPVCSGTGRILHERWNNIKGQSVSYIPVDTPPDETRTLSLFEAQTNVGDYYGARIRGYICIPTDGEYTFYISSDDHSELWLSDGPNPANKKKIAYVMGATSKRQWNKYPSQQSVKIYLKKGVQYYVEVLHKENLGYDHVAVGWMRPDGTLERPISGMRLSPYDVNASTAQARVAIEETAEEQAGDETTLTLTPNPVKNGKVMLSTRGFKLSHDSELSVQVITLTGEIIHTARLTCVEDCNEADINLAGKVRPGIYLVKGSANGKIFMQRMVVE